jgi:hypothetical protein
MVVRVVGVVCVVRVGALRTAACIDLYMGDRIAMPPLPVPPRMCAHPPVIPGGAHDRAAGKIIAADLGEVDPTVVGKSNRFRGR